MARQINHFYEFGSVRLDATNRLLYKDGEELALQPKVIETLLVLVRDAPAVVDKDTILTTVWKDVIVEEGGLKRNISLLRKALGDEGRFIETLPKRGYRLSADVRESWEEIPAFAAERPAPEFLLERRANLRITHEEEEIDSSDRRFRLFGRGHYLVSVRLRVLAVSASALVLIIAGFAFWRATSLPGGGPRSPIRSIAVLPFKILTSHGDDAHLGIGMADVLITRLSSIRELQVRPTSAVMNLSETEQDWVRAGRLLSVDAVLEGSIHRAGDRTRITARLMRVSDQQPIWAGQFDDRVGSQFTLQNTIAEQLVGPLQMTLSQQERQALTKKYTDNPDAYALYMAGRYQLNKRSGDGVQQAERLFRGAIEKDPNFAIAYVGLADTLTMEGVYNESAAAIEKAMQLDDSIAEAYASRGFWRMFKGWQWAEAEADFIRSIQISSGCAASHHWYATLLAVTGRLEQAKAQLQLALEIDPLSHNFLADMGQLHYFARQYDEAERYCRRALESYPDFVFARQYLFDIYVKKGEPDLAFHEEMMRVSANAKPPTDSAEVIARRIAQSTEGYRKVGLRGLWRGAIEELLHRRADSFNYFSLLRNYALLGETEKALESLELSCDNHDFMLPFVNADPIYDDLRSEPRFQAVLRRMGLTR